MKKLKKLLCALLPLPILFNISAPVIHALALPESASPYTVTLTYPMTVYVDGIYGVADIDAQFNPNWFGTSAYTYNHELCRTSCIISTVAGSAYYLRLNAQRLGFTDFHFNDVHSSNQYNEDGIACAFAKRDIGDSTLILIAMGGTSAEQWIGNFKIDDSIVHRSFDAAANSVTAELDEYIAALRASGSCGDKIGFWVTGHSRGAAVANLVVSRLDKAEYTSSADVFAYTFATPNVTTNSETSAPLYKNIFNIVNGEDFVPYAPLPQWGYSKYGTVFELPSANNLRGRTSYKRKEELLKKYSELTLGAQYRCYERGTSETADTIRAINYTSGGSIDGFLHNEYDLSSVLPTSLADKYNLHNTVTPAGFFNMIGQLLAGQLNYEQALPTIALAAVHPAFCYIVKYFATGAFSSSEVKELLTGFFESNPGISQYITLEELSPLIDSLMDNKIFCAHRSETYLAWLETINETELTLQENDKLWSADGPVRITTGNGSAIGDIATVIVPPHGIYALHPLALSYTTPFDEGEIKSVKWYSSNIFVPVANGKVTNTVNCYMRTTVTVKLTDSSGNVFRDSITVVFYRHNRQLQRLVPYAYENSHMRLLTNEQKTMVKDLVVEKVKNYVLTRVSLTFSSFLPA